MGAKQSTQNLGVQGQRDPESLRQAINETATKYILTKEFKRIQDLAREDTCSKLIILTSDMIAKYLDDAEIEYLAQHLNSDGTVLDKTVKERVVFFDRDAAQGESPTMGVQSRTKKTRMCVGIAQFYVKIFNLFAAIATTVNPELSYTDPATGKKTTVSILDKDKIPKGADARRVYKNICGSRIEALFGTDVSDTNAAPGVITIRPGVCSINQKTKGGHPSLMDEPGIPELRNLYYDEYNYQTGKFDKMTAASKASYLADVQAMYRVFTGAENVPDTVTSFGAIPLAQYWRTPVCDKKVTEPVSAASPNKSNFQISFPMPSMSGAYNVQSAPVAPTSGGGRTMTGGSPISGAFRQNYTGSTKIAVYANYAKHVGQMMAQSEATEQELLGILREVFLPATSGTEKTVTLNPTLTHASLEQIIIKTRATITKLYSDCEKNFQTGIDMLEGVVQYQFAETSKRRGENLREQLDNLGVR